MNQEYNLEDLPNPRTLYLKSCESKCDNYKTVENLNTMDFWALYRVDEITFEDKAPRKEALENVISSMCIEGINFVYIIIGNPSGINFYYGVAKDFSFKGQRKLEISDIGEGILRPNLQGNFRGSKITAINPDEEQIILETIKEFKESKILEGVPGINKDDEQFQSVDRVIDVMLGDKFSIVLIAKPISNEYIYNIQNKMYDFYNSLAPLGKSSIQNSTGKSSSTSNSETIGDSQTKGTNKSITKQKGTSKDNNNSKNQKETTSYNESGTEGSSDSSSKNSSKTESKQEGQNTGGSATLEIVNKKIQDWIKYMDEVILPRLDYGLGKGLFITSTLLLGDNPASIIKLENTLKSVYGSESGNRMPLEAFPLKTEETILLKNMQIPILNIKKTADENEIAIRTACSQLFIGEDKVLLGNWMSSQEISLLAGLPQKEVVGLTLKEEIEFGLNVKTNQDNSIRLGYLVQSGTVLNGENGVAEIPVFYDKSYFDKHIFVTGVTGSGKTTTCKKLLLESGNNFLVIEPAKTEYRILAENKDVLVFTLGKENGAPFRLNPFEFFEGENITSRVDMIKASMEAAFDMEAAIPQLLETAIYECYEDKGWNISNNKNYKYDNPFADGVFSFPTLSDLERKVDEVVKKQGFDDRLRDEYIGSIHARLKGLTIGAKGLMLNTPRSIDFIELLDKKVILELEYIKSGPEKSLIMGFILANLSEAIRTKYNFNNKQPINHITLIEEAHRLLSKYTPGDSMNKKQGVEMFTDMLAEVRKYGESLIIADQIPNKLTPEVLKNTNTKIVHRIFAQDDKEAIGNTMALKDEQKEHLSYLTSGRAIMMNPGFSRAIQIQIDKSAENDTERPPLNDDILRNKIIEYYRKNYKRGVLPGLEKLNSEPDNHLIKIYLDYLQPNSPVIKEYYYCIHKKEISDKLISEIKTINKLYDMKDAARIISCHCHDKKHLQSNPEIKDYVYEILKSILDKGHDFSMKDYCKKQPSHYNMLDWTIFEKK